MQMNEASAKINKYDPKCFGDGKYKQQEEDRRETGLKIQLVKQTEK